MKWRKIRKKTLWGARARFLKLMIFFRSIRHCGKFAKSTQTIKFTIHSSFGGGRECTTWGVACRSLSHPLTMPRHGHGFPNNGLFLTDHTTFGGMFNIFPKVLQKWDLKFDGETEYGEIETYSCWIVSPKNWVNLLIELHMVKNKSNSRNGSRTCIIILFLQVLLDVVFADVFAVVNTSLMCAAIGWKK